MDRMSAICRLRAVQMTNTRVEHAQARQDVGRHFQKGDKQDNQSDLNLFFKELAADPPYGSKGSSGFLTITA